MPFVYFQTFGCQMNVADSDELKRKLESRGFEETSCIADADLIIVNTCTVRQNAENKAIARIKEFSKLKKTQCLLWVTGCMAQRMGDTLKEAIPGVSLVIGAKEIDNFDTIINDHLLQSSFYNQEHHAHSSVSDFITVMRGCNNYCAYCIVPYVRGDEYSIQASSILDTIKARLDDGVSEITLLGQNVNSYNDNGTDFADLIVKVSALDGLKRLRFTTSHPKDCSDKLIRTVAETPQCCSHFHLPVQAGSDRILSIMNRRYTSKDYLNKIDTIRKHIPHADITTDILVGFPTETDEEFNDTLALVKQVRYTTAFMFAYSVREGTAASKMIDNIPKQEKLDRLNRLIEAQTQITKEIYDSMVGVMVAVMINGRQDKREKFWMGQDNGCKRILVAGEHFNNGDIIRCSVKRSSGMTLVCDTQ
jgi:tRNA-2-methylthio-N6-dimethylallyladenosine synthase